MLPNLAVPCYTVSDWPISLARCRLLCTHARMMSHTENLDSNPRYLERLRFAFELLDDGCQSFRIDPVFDKTCEDGQRSLIKPAIQNLRHFKENCIQGDAALSVKSSKCKRKLLCLELTYFPSFPWPHRTQELKSIVLLADDSSSCPF